MPYTVGYFLGHIFSNNVMLKESHVIWLCRVYHTALWLGHTTLFFSCEFKVTRDIVLLNKCVRDKGLSYTTFSDVSPFPASLDFYSVIVGSSNFIKLIWFLSSI